MLDEPLKAYKKILPRIIFPTLIVATILLWHARVEIHEYFNFDALPSRSSETSVSIGVGEHRLQITAKSCTQDTDCAIWPCGCCCLEPLNINHTPKEPHPDYVCEMECPWAGTDPQAKCLHGKCTISGTERYSAPKRDPLQESKKEKECIQQGGKYFSLAQCPKCPENTICEQCFVGCQYPKKDEKVE